jgi:hypothetical protein
MVSNDTVDEDEDDTMSYFAKLANGWRSCWQV